MIQYKESEFDDQSLACSNCGWKGNGADAIVIRLYGLSKMKEVHCPQCDNLLGELQTADIDTPGGDTGDELSNQIG